MSEQNKARQQRGPVKRTPHEGVALALELIAAGETLEPLYLLEQALEADRVSPAFDGDPGLRARALAYYAWLVALERGQSRSALETLQHAMEQSDSEPAVYQNLARVYLKTGRKVEAIHTLRAGLEKIPGDKALITDLENLGVRRAPVLPFLPRKHVLNRWLGKIRHRFNPPRASAT